MTGADVQRVLVVDDDPLDCTIVQKITQRVIGEETEVRCFLHASAALEFLQSIGDKSSSGVTLIFVDVQMPVMNGFEFVERVQSLPSATVGQLRIYILSSSANGADRDRAAQQPGILRFLQKPLTTRVVSELLAGL